MGLRFVLADSSSSVWRALYELAGEPVAKMTGMVTGLPSVDRPERARVFGLDAEGLPRVRAQVDEGGRFELFVPQSISLWYAAIDPSRTSTPVAFTSGLPWDLRLDVSPGGELLARVLDADTGHAADGPPPRARHRRHARPELRARLPRVRRGPDHRLAPRRGGDSAPHGALPRLGDEGARMEHRREDGGDRERPERCPSTSPCATSSPRRGSSRATCTSTRARASTRPVLAEDRVLSLVAAGIDFAVPSEHNLIGDYGPALEALDLTRDLATVNGVEITTFWPALRPLRPLPVRGSQDPAVQGDQRQRRLQLRAQERAERDPPGEPPAPGKGHRLLRRLPLRPEADRPPPACERDFDTLEVYNGYETRTAEELEVDPARLVRAPRHGLPLRGDRQQRLAPHPVPVGRLPADDGDRRRRCGRETRARRSTRRRSSPRSRRGTRS